MTGADYRVPTSELKCLSPRKAPRSRYRYLDSDGALLTSPVWPIPPETKEKFNTTENETAAEVSVKYKSKRDDCRERIHDNRRSHFQFGSNVDSKHSEQVICGLTLMITVYFFYISEQRLLQCNN